MTFFLLVSVAMAAEFKCHDDGSVIIKGLSKKYKIGAKQKGTSDPYVPVPGKWKMQLVGDKKKKKVYRFYSEEAQFIVAKPTKFYLKLNKRRKELLQKIIEMSDISKKLPDCPPYIYHAFF